MCEIFSSDADDAKIIETVKLNKNFVQNDFRLYSFKTKEQENKESNPQFFDYNLSEMKCKIFWYWCFKKQKGNTTDDFSPFFDQNFQRKKWNPHQSPVIFLPRRIPFFSFFSKRRSHEINILFRDYVFLKLSFVLKDLEFWKYNRFWNLKYLRQSLELMILFYFVLFFK